MIVIPLTKHFSWRRPPLVTIGLIVINLFVFAVIQRHDDARWSEAQRFYVESGLSEIEIGLYQRYLDERRPSANDTAETKLAKPEPQKQIEQYRRLVRDATFLDQLRAGKVVPEKSPEFLKWRQLREDYEARLKKSVTFSYGFRPADTSVASWFTHMFLHGGWEHVIGNMVFLWLIGCLIEYGCRHLFFPMIYFLGGLCATGFFYLLNMNSTLPLVGASGAIAGIMGAFAVFYGFKKVRIFLNLGFYFNYIRFPAIFLLPFWMGNELLQLLMDRFSPVAYAAHFGGLAGGALVAWAALKIPGVIDPGAFESAEEDQSSNVLEKALAHMGRLEFDQARRLLQQLLLQSPDDLAIWRHLHVIDRQNPQALDYHHTTKNLLELLCRQPDTYPTACALFKEYLQTARPPKLPAELYLKASYAFIETGKLDDARRILLTLQKKAPRLANLPMALLKLAQRCMREGDRAGGQQCVRVLSTHYPGAQETRIALEQCQAPGQSGAR